MVANLDSSGQCWLLSGQPSLWKKVSLDGDYLSETVRERQDYPGPLDRRLLGKLVKRKENQRPTIVWSCVLLLSPSGASSISSVRGSCFTFSRNISSLFEEERVLF